MRRSPGAWLGFWTAGALIAWVSWLAAMRAGAGDWAGAVPAAVLSLWGALALALALPSGRGRSTVDARPGDGIGPPSPPASPRDDRPADGEVGILPVRGVVGTPGEAAPEFRRFDRLEPMHGEAPFRGFRVWGRRFPPLLGRVAIVSVFLGRDGRAWSDDELAQAHRALTRAGTWIEREAIRWRVPVNVDLADTYFAGVEQDADREVAVFRPDEWGNLGHPDPDAEARILALLGRTAAALGFADPVDLLGRIGRRIEADQLVWLLHVRRAGKSIALPSDATGIPGVAVAVCYAREEDVEAPMAGPPFADPTTFVHELMHLFGATDKYGVPLSDFPRGTVSERDVMVLGVEALSRLVVEPMTAVEIGWASSIDDRPTGPAVPLRGAPTGRPRPKTPRRPRRPG